MRVSCGVQPLPPGAARPFLRLAKYTFHTLSNRRSLAVCDVFQKKICLFSNQLKCIFILYDKNFHLI